jgi:hypothetical protein
MGKGKHLVEYLWDWNKKYGCSQPVRKYLIEDSFKLQRKPNLQISSVAMRADNFHYSTHMLRS